MKDNREFNRVVTKAIERGRLQCGEIAETALLKKIKEGSMDAIKFYLTHNDPRYIPKRSISVEPLSEKERAEYNHLKEKHEHDDETSSPETYKYLDGLIDFAISKASSEERAKLSELVDKDKERDDFERRIKNDE